MTDITYQLYISMYYISIVIIIITYLLVYMNINNIYIHITYYIPLSLHLYNIYDIT